jgi:DNA-binding LacI/PurR family transcriptional regulator
MQAGRKIKYQSIASRLREDIISGRVREGDLLPSQKQLISDNGISLGTARHVIDSLVSEGWAMATQGKGIYAKIPKPPSVVNNTRSNLIGYAMLGITSEYDPVEQMIIKGMMPVMQNANRNLVVASFPADVATTKDFVAFLDNLSGIVISAFIEKPFLDILNDKGIKTVIIGGGYPSGSKWIEGFYNVQADAVHSGYLAGQSLAMHGHQNVYLICQLGSNYGVEIREGFQKSCKDYGLENQSGRRLQGVKTENEIAEILSTLPDITGIACVGDMHSCRLIQNLKLLGIDVPGQKSVISIGGLPRNILSEPNLSRINGNITEMGREAANLILSETKSVVHKKIPSYFEKGATLAQVTSRQASNERSGKTFKGKSDS